MATSTLVDGIVTSALRAIPPFLIRVSMSLIGSLTLMRSVSVRPFVGYLVAGLPARLRHTRELALGGQLTETDSADAEFAHVRAASAAELASIDIADLEFSW